MNPLRFGNGFLKFSKTLLKVAQTGRLGRTARAGSSYRAITYETPTMNELPVPQGDWQREYDKQQRKNNRHLILGVGFFVFTVLAVTTSGIVQFNATIPKLNPDDFPPQPVGKCPPPPKC